jgi:hypothetical protein
MWVNIWTKLGLSLGPSMRTVNVHEANKPWAPLVPLETDRPRRQPGLLRGQLQLPPIDVLLAPLPS